MLVSPKLNLIRHTCLWALVLVGISPVLAQQDDQSTLLRIQKALDQLTTAIGADRVASQKHTRLLFPFVTQLPGFDTSIAVANTGKDSSGVVGKPGRCKINYFGSTLAGGPAPAQQVTTADIPVGQTLRFSLSVGGDFGIVGTPGFSGYLEIDCEFPFAHGYALISDLGVSRLADGYLALVMPMTRSSSYIEALGQ